MNGRTAAKTALALLLAAGMAWSGGVMGGEENRGLSPIISKRVLGVCEAIVGPEGGHKEASMGPVTYADLYMYRYEHRSNYFSIGSVTRIVQQPKHGKLVLEDKRDPELPDDYKYFPDKNFDGHDTFVIEVEKDGIKVQVRYRIEVASGGNSLDLCPGGREFWKINIPTPTLDPNALHPLLATAGGVIRDRPRLAA